MLSLSAKVQEIFYVILPDGREASIRVIDAYSDYNGMRCAGRCRLGFSFPKDVKILREKFRAVPPLSAEEGEREPGPSSVPPVLRDARSA